MPSHPFVIQVQDLEFSYTAKQQILNKLNLSVPESSIYGFLGANGAGKSTTIRSILGLLKPQAGKISLFGMEQQSANRMPILRKVGALIEDPSLYKHLSGYDNLKIACKYLNLPTSRIGEVLELVNLEKNSRKISKEYSTGMKQRLGLAIALLPDPDLLILDEPTNGLDPTGIIEIRNILKHLHEQGKTIFLSSHLLSEIEKIATQVGIVKDGKTVFQGAIEDLENLRKKNFAVNIVASNSSEIAGKLNGKYPSKILGSENMQIYLDEREALPVLINDLVTMGARLYEVSPQRDNLEELFIDLTTNQA
ncbi:MAG TPA: ATP-binding cassette domain-containing protein [Flavilitoribacter sp.]|nr:ATP-binding cassette domain-containing protein [Flavilitoribacter sp.]HMQ89109.1 ATP-binding cassette domain-containing protein [Flavilitoribacter sp.]